MDQVDFESRVGQFFIDESDGKVYQLIGYCANPSITMVEVGKTGNSDGKINVGVGGLTAQNFKPVGKNESELIQKAVDQTKAATKKTFRGLGVHDR